MRAHSLVVLLVLVACGSPPPTNAVVTYTPPSGPSKPLPVVVVMPPANSGPPLTVVVAPPAPPRPVPGDVSDVPNRNRFYPAEDSDREPHVRKKTAVLLYAEPSARINDGTESLDITTVRRLTFEPVLCVLNGRLAAGLPCAEAMPAKATVRITGGLTMEVVRRNAPFKDTASERTFPAPYAPSCCMYNTCVGRTIPYAPKDDGMTALHTDRTVLAVWPKDADIDLLVETPEAFDEKKQGTWHKTSGSPGAREYIPIATADMDGDKRREVLVYERWANDAGFFVVAKEGDAPLFRVSCGNI